MLTGIRRFFRRVKNIVSWLPFLWKDENYDYAYILFVFKRKIELTRKTFEKSKYHDNRVAIKNMLVVEKLIERIVDDSYADYELSEHSKKWGKFRPLGKSDNPNLPALRREGVKSLRDLEAEQKEAKIVYKKMEELQKQDLDLLFKILRRRLLTWWD